jgi:hypothetical protein
MISKSWSKTPIPEFLARKHFGLAAHAELLGKPSWQNIEEALEKQGGEGVFCDEKEATAYLNDVCAADLNSTSKKADIRGYSISPPVFDADFQKAAIVVEGVLNNPGPLGCGFAAGGGLYVLMKNADGWEITETAQLYTAD